MSNMREFYASAVAKLGPQAVQSMAFCAGGSCTGKWDDIPRADAFVAVIKRMTASKSAVARAQSDFAKLNEVEEANRKARNAPAKPKPVLNATEIYARWNKKPDQREDA